MTHLRLLAVSSLALVLGLAAPAAALNLWPHSLPKQPNVYLVRGYVDEAPVGTTVIDRITITDLDGKTRRELLITSYGYGRISYDEELSRNMSNRYTIRGPKEQVASLIGAPKGTEIDGKFFAFTDGVPFLVIATLEVPAKPAGGNG